MNLRYFQISLSYKMGPSKDKRFKEGKLKFLVDLEKWKTFDFPCSTVSPN